MIRTLFLLSALALFSCSDSEVPSGNEVPNTHTNQSYLVVLGIAQDAGFPQLGCKKDCCKPLWKQAHPGEFVVSLGLIDPITEKKYLFECTPDIRQQLNLLNETAEFGEQVPDGIFLTHAHMGHYSGLMHFGREAMGSDNIPVHVMPRFKDFLETNGPWDQLVSLHNIELEPLRADSATRLGPFLITPLLVPHRDEYSETVGFIIEGSVNRVLFIPDIDKWQKWDRDLKKMLAQVDFAFLDATFYANGEIEGRDMSEIPHPFVEESMSLLENIPAADKAKVHFIHMNHTNPLLRQPEQRQVVLDSGFNIAFQGQKVEL